MNSKSSIPCCFQPTWTTTDEPLAGVPPRLVSRHRDSGAKARILVIDEDFSAIPSLQSLLQDDGYSVDIRSHLNFTVMAEEMFEDYQAVIVDIMIPHGNGFDLLCDICTTTQLPVLVLTARSSEEDRIVGLELGADDYVAKPCRPREVVARIRALMRRGSAGAR